MLIQVRFGVDEVGKILTQVACERLKLNPNDYEQVTNTEVWSDEEEITEAEEIIIKLEQKGLV